MTNAEKLTMLETMLFPDGIDASEQTAIEAQLNVYLALAESEILSYKYEYSSDGIPTEMPSKYDVIQIQAVAQGFAQAGAEGQVLSIENGIHRHWRYVDMADYIHSNVIPIARVL